jgi:hypothetical protein
VIALSIRIVAQSPVTPAFDVASVKPNTSRPAARWNTW